MISTAEVFLSCGQK
jgi:hypothetical protein